MHKIDGTNTKLDDVIVLAKTIWGEARGEGVRGMVAVGLVIWNRLHDHRWPSSWQEVCTQRKQFSTWNVGDPNRRLIDEVTLDDLAFQSAFQIAARLVTLGPDREAGDITNGANHYLTTELYASLRRPDWAKSGGSLRVVAEIGNHTFMRG